MRKKALLITLLVLTGTAVAALADTFGEVESDVPFPFVVENTTLPAGKYIVRSDEPLHGTVYSLESADGSLHVDFLAEDIPSTTTHDPALVFDRVGGRYFLAQLWIADSLTGHQVVKSRTQLSLEKDGMPRHESRSVPMHKRAGR